MIVLYISSGLALFISLLYNRQKTMKAMQIALKKFGKMLPSFLLMIILISVSLFFVPDKLIIKYLGGTNFYLSTFLASLLGSVAVMPGFIAFPLGGLLVKKGVAYSVIAAFTTTLMLVGLLSYPFERKFLGHKITLIRNIISYLIAMIVTLGVAIFYGEIKW